MMMIVLRLLSLLLSLLGLKSRWHGHFSPRLPNKVFFRGGWGVAGFVDSGPKTLVPSASNRSTPEWTRVDSSGLPPRAIRAGRANCSPASATSGQGEALSDRYLRHPGHGRIPARTAGHGSA